MYVNNSATKSCVDPTAYSKRIEKFKNSLVPGMSLTVYIVTGDNRIDEKARKAKVVHVYKNFCLLRDDKGIMYGPDYHKLIEWGNA